MSRARAHSSEISWHRISVGWPKREMRFEKRLAGTFEFPVRARRFRRSGYLLVRFLYAAQSCFNMNSHPPGFGCGLAGDLHGLGERLTD